MANEITVTASLVYAKGSARAQISGSLRADQAGDKYVQAVQTIGTVEENVDVGDIGTVGYVSVRNMDATNYVELGATTGVYTVKISAGGFALVPWDGTAIFAKAHTGSVEIEYLAVEA